MIVCIVGPTGVGKTKLSEELSIYLDAIVVNCDAMQVYKDMNIGTAKYKASEDLGQPHMLFDIVSPDQIYTVFDYQKDLRKVIEDNKDRNIVLVGGTGLYLKAGLFNYEFMERETKSFDEYTNEELYEMLKHRGDLDEIHVNNRRRMISRLNSSGNNALKDELLYDDVYFIGLTTDRENLYKRIDDRVDVMMSEGLLEEAAELYKKYGSTKALRTGIGYKELIAYIDGDISKEDAVSLVKQRSRKYAKRQYTWFKHQMDVTWFETNYEDFSKTIDNVKSYLSNRN